MKELPAAALNELRSNSKVSALKIIRAEWSCSLKEAVDAVDEYLLSHPEVKADISAMQSLPLPEDIQDDVVISSIKRARPWSAATIDALRSGNVSRAILIVRAVYGPVVLFLLLLVAIIAGALNSFSRW